MHLIEEERRSLVLSEATEWCPLPAGEWLRIVSLSRLCNVQGLKPKLTRLLSVTQVTGLSSADTAPTVPLRRETWRPTCSVSIACLSTTASTPTAGSSAPEWTQKPPGTWRSQRLPRQGARQSCPRRAARPRSDAQQGQLCSALPFTLALDIWLVRVGLNTFRGKGWSVTSQKGPECWKHSNICICTCTHTCTYIYICIYRHRDIQSYPHWIYIYIHTCTQNTHIPYVCVCKYIYYTCKINFQPLKMAAKQLPGNKYFQTM